MQPLKRAILKPPVETASEPANVPPGDKVNFTQGEFAVASETQALQCCKTGPCK
jgi:hypothetical protein